MKIIYTLIFALGLVISSPAQTNNIIANTNVEQSIVSILAGAKDVGSDIYATSKSVISSGIDIVKSQSPELISEFLRWSFAEAVFYVILAILFIGGGCLAFRHYQKQASLNLSERAFSEIISCVYLFAGLAVGLPLLCHNLLTIIQITVAPKIFIIEYVIDVIKTPHS